MTYAIVEVGGGQLIVEPGRFYDLNYIHADPGDNINLNRVLFVSKDSKYYVGKPCLSQTYIKATVLRHFSGNKITVFKMKSKKNSRFRRGHRQKLTRVFIEEIV